MTSVPRPLSALAASAVAIVLLAGCTSPQSAAPAVTAEPAETPAASASAAPSADPAASPSAAPTPEREPIPFNVACDSLLTAQQIYDFNPNFGTNPDYSPAADSLAQDVVENNAGTACSWLNQTSGETIDIAVAAMPAETSEEYKNALVMNSNFVPTYGDEAYFEIDGSGAGVAQVFSGEYYIAAQSTVFYEPGDAEPLIDAVIANLG
ncbi:iron ABC transporter ATP-binding protein [Desertivibrio insolitus]|uniref:iron ABC transporter ATP-binding protein n=1 Tax=Herbiconiux sp. SYSU D00978 TaxID=2812562 RepID=UPI001A95B362|nr:iron ABC transporter ATP-binding protein [Herbiconiux sp. SYSU D00978]